MAYDSREYVEEHIERVQNYIGMITYLLINRGNNHDRSKLEEPEKSVFDEYTPKLREVEYGSPEYRQYLAEMKPALDHHYANNYHHPEAYVDGINDMNLVDIIEMLCDWKAANEKKDTMDFVESIKMNQLRFNLSDQLTKILINSVNYFNWQ